MVLERNFGGNPLVNAIVSAMQDLAVQSAPQYIMSVRGGNALRGASHNIMEHIRFWHHKKEVDESLLQGLTAQAPFEDPNLVRQYEDYNLCPIDGVFDPQTCGLVTLPSNKNIGFEMLRRTLESCRIHVHPLFFTLSPTLQANTVAEKIVQQLDQCLRMPYKLKTDPRNPEKETSLPETGVGMGSYIYGKKLQHGTKDDLITSIAMLIYVSWEMSVTRTLQQV